MGNGGAGRPTEQWKYLSRRSLHGERRRFVTAAQNDTSPTDCQPPLARLGHFRDAAKFDSFRPAATLE